MKKLFISILLCVSFHVSAQSSEPFSTWNFETTVSSVDVNILNGSITLIGNTVSETTVEMFILDYSPQNSEHKWSYEEIKQEFEKTYTIDVKIEDEKLLVTVKPKTDRCQLSISFKIITPKSINSNLRTLNGSISISNLSGSQHFITTNGSLNIDHVSGEINGRTTNNSINAKKSRGKITLQTTNGNITAENLKGVIALSTTNGKVREHNVKRKK